MQLRKYLLWAGAAACVGLAGYVVYRKLVPPVVAERPPTPPTITVIWPVGTPEKPTEIPYGTKPTLTGIAKDPDEYLVLAGVNTYDEYGRLIDYWKEDISPPVPEHTIIRTLPILPKGTYRVVFFARNSTGVGGLHDAMVTVWLRVV